MKNAERANHLFVSVLIHLIPNFVPISLPLLSLSLSFGIPLFRSRIILLPQSPIYISGTKSYEGIPVGSGVEQYFSSLMFHLAFDLLCSYYSFVAYQYSRGLSWMVFSLNMKVFFQLRFFASRHFILKIDRKILTSYNLPCFNYSLQDPYRAIAIQYPLLFNNNMFNQDQGQR